MRATYPSLRGKRVIVTGGGPDIGAAIVEAFARQDAHVAFVDVAEAESHALVERLSAEAAVAPRFVGLDPRDLDALRCAAASRRSRKSLAACAPDTITSWMRAGDN